MSHEIKSSSLDLLPLYVDLVHRLIEESVTQLRSLQIPQYKIDNALECQLSTLCDSDHLEKLELFELCKNWRELDPNCEQLMVIGKIEIMAHELEQLCHAQLLLTTKLANEKTVSLTNPLVETPQKNTNELSFEFFLNQITD